MLSLVDRWRRTLEHRRKLLKHKFTCTMALADWKTAVNTSQDSEVQPELVTTVTSFFVNAGMENPHDAIGLVKEDLQNGQNGVSWPSKPPELALTRKVLLHINVVAEAERAVAKQKKIVSETESETAAQSIQDKQEQNMRIFGCEASALEVAKLMVAEDAKPITSKRSSTN